MVGSGKLFKDLKEKNIKACSQANRFNWRKEVNSKPKDPMPGISFNKLKENKKTTCTLDAKGAPDLKSIREQLSEKMKKFRNAK